jgi:hypothetical protein
MGNNFVSQATPSSSFATANTFVTVYTATVTNASIVIGCLISNVTNSSITVSAQIIRAAGGGAGTAGATTGTVTLLDNLSIPAGSSFDIVQSNKYVLAYNGGSGDYIQVSCNTSSGCATWVSVLQGVN